MKNFFVAAFCIFFIFVSSSCGFIVKTFLIKNVDRNQNQAILSTTDLSDKVSFSGFLDLLEKFKEVKVLLVHGIGPTKEFDYGEEQMIPLINQSIERLTQKSEVKITLEEEYRTTDTVSYQFKDGSNVCSYLSILEFLVKENGVSTGKKLQYFVVHWACATEPIKKELNEVDSLIYKYKDQEDYIVGSELVKRFLINETFSEAFAYANSEVKEAIQTPVKRAIELMSALDPVNSLKILHQDVNEYNQYLHDPQNLIPTPQLESPNPYDFAFVSVTRSFGGKVVFDVANNFGEQDPLRQRFCGYSHQFFMLCNQLSLVKLLDEDETLSNEIHLFYQSHKEVCKDPLKLIAFYDLLDVLSYNLEESLGAQDSLEILNVGVSNTKSNIRLRGPGKTFLINQLIKNREFENPEQKEKFKDSLKS